MTSIHVYWYVLPLIAAIGLVYSASRYEEWKKIVSQAIRLCGMLLTVLLVTTAILAVINTQISGG